jgi:hypothetical protein
VRLVTDRPTVDSFPLGSGGREDPRGPPRPTPRGPLSAAVLLAHRQPPGSLGPTPPAAVVDALADDDLQLALYLCYELHYRGLAGADADWEWDPALLGFRTEMERAFLQRLYDEIGPVRRAQLGDVRGALSELIAGESSPSLSSFLLESGTLVQLQEFCVHRSAYQLKEADPHTFVIPRLSGGAKAAMVEIQLDEYGSGRATDMHSVLFGTTMTALDLDPAYGAYLDRLPGATLATVNQASMFGLHRRRRAALVGHLAVFEMTSVGPMERYSRALAGVGISSEGRRFYDVHVEADAWGHRTGADGGRAHRDRTVTRRRLALRSYCRLLVEQRFSRHLVNSWSSGRSSLLRPGNDLTMRTSAKERTVPRSSSTRRPSTLALSSLRTRTN